MVECKAVINDPKDGKSYKVDIKQHHLNALMGKKIGEEIDGIYVGLPSYRLKISGGSDRDGFPMRKDLPGRGRRRLLLTETLGFHPKKEGMRKKKSVCGNEIGQNTVQVNMKIIKAGSRPVKELLEASKQE
jgi:small subunit ribosomal protein S6e